MREMFTGDCRVILDTLPERSVHCVVTSPPYWGLRDYGVPDQLGLEPTPEEYVANLVDVFRKVRRVLRDDGTVWLNLGDSYAADGRGTGGNRVETSPKQRTNHGSYFREAVRPRHGLKPKDLVGIPWRVAFALQADGWYLRSDIIWAKPNPMPESVTDRPTKSHEYVFLLAKSARYYFDADAVREADAGLPIGNGFAGRMGGARQTAVDGGGGSPERFTPGAGRNIRTVWTIATQPYAEAHFATFPEALVVPCIKAGTSERGVCPECGAPWERMVERERIGVRNTSAGSNGQQQHRDGVSHDLYAIPATTTGWRPACAHDAEPVPASVLDPFAGSGTVGLVAERLSRRAVLIELNPEYASLIGERTQQTGLGLTA